jgi:hypothetical protein
VFLTPPSAGAGALRGCSTQPPAFDHFIERDLSALDPLFKSYFPQSSIADKSIVIC